MSGAFFNVSGIDPNDGAKIVSVWCRDSRAKGPDNYVLLGSGHVVDAGGCAPPPGISVGQFSVTFALPYGCSADDIVVTDDKNSKEPLPDVTVTPCLVSGASRSGGTIARGGPAAPVGTANPFAQPQNCDGR